MKIIISILGLTLLTGCAGSLGDIESGSEIVRGCSYIACAIVTHGILNFFR